MVSGANFLLDVIPYRHSEAAHILGGRSTALGQALALTSENDFGTLYRPGSALLTCPSCQGRMRLLAVVKNPVSMARGQAFASLKGGFALARYLSAAGELTDVPSRAPGRGPPYWKSQVLRRQALGDEGDGGDPGSKGDEAA